MFKELAPEPLSVEEFGRLLIETHDLDPVYDAVVGMEMGGQQARRWLLAYWMYYSVGVASWLSEHEGSTFWHWVRAAALNEAPTPSGGRWPRGRERRHFRGPKCVRAVERLAQMRPEHWVGALRGLHDYRGVMSRVESWPMCGPWIAFKAADMLERCLGWGVVFDRDIGLIYDEPRKGLYMLSEERGVGVEAVYDDLLGHFSRYPAPPTGDRDCGPQEVETILCKYKAHRNGHYWVGQDIHEVGDAFLGWGETAARGHEAMPLAVGRKHG